MSSPRSKNMEHFKENLSVNKVFHCAREAFMSMLVRLSWAPVLMKCSWACSWSPHEHMRARPLYRIMRPGVSYRAGTWLIDECQIAFFMSCLMLRVWTLDLPFLLLFSLSFVLPSTICLISWIPRIPVLCSPGSVTTRQPGLVCIRTSKKA